MNGDIRVDYDILPGIAAQLSNETGRIHTILHQLQQCRAALQNAWQGRGAAVFFKEMDTAILPEFTRLASALDLSSVSLKTIQQIFQIAEEEGARLVQVGGAMPATSGGDGSSPKSIQPPIVPQGHLRQDGGDDGTPDFPPGLIVIVTKPGVNFRETASISGNIKGQFNSGEILTIEDGPITDAAGNEWYAVKRSDGSTGYVSAEYVKRYIPTQHNPDALKYSDDDWLGGYGCGAASVVSGLIFKGWLPPETFADGMDWFDEHVASNYGMQPSTLETTTEQYLDEIVNPQREAEGKPPLSVSSQAGMTNAAAQKYIEDALSRNEIVIVDVLCTGEDAARVVVPPPADNGDGAYAHFMQVDSLEYDANGVLTMVHLVDTVSGAVIDVSPDDFWASMTNPEVYANDVKDPQETTNWVMTIGPDS